jgi:hypothetical protein
MDFLASMGRTMAWRLGTTGALPLLFHDYLSARLPT